MGVRSFYFSKLNLSNFNYVHIYKNRLLQLISNKYSIKIHGEFNETNSLL